VTARYLGMRPADLDGKAYAKHWNPTMAPLPAYVREAIAHGPVASPLLPPLERAPDLLARGYHELEDGIALQPGGALHVAVRTEMPRTSPAMVDWWFGWHSAEAPRYKLWHPRAHVHAAWRTPKPPGLRGRAAYVGRVSIVDEYVGSELGRYAIGFVAPASLGFDETALADPERATVVCARVGFAKAPFDFGYLVHHVRLVAGGAEMRSRFWLGGRHAAVRRGGVAGAVAARAAGRLLAPGAAEGLALLVHCSQEMSHLASFLPGLYAELRDVE
jgi:hypothetical protein